MQSKFWKSIVNKVRLSILGTAAIAVTVSGTFVIVSEYFLNRDSFVNRVTSLSAVVAFNLRAPIVFDDAGEVRATLDSLATVPSIGRSLVLDETGQLIATYTNPEQSPEFSDSLGNAAQAVLDTSEPVTLIEGRRMHHVQPVVLDGEDVGVLAVEASLDEIYALMRLQLIALIAILGLALLVAFLAGSTMQRFITVPIQQLVEAMKGVSTSRTYEVRVNKRSDDEIGVLVDGFNEMLGEIQARDRMLAEANDDLERQVRDRTGELEHANSVLSTTLSEVERAKETAEAANRAKGAFLATMSHEIRTPINGMLGNTELLLNEPLSEKARTYAEIAYRSGEALLDIINDILDFSRIEAGRLEIVEAEFDLGRLVRELSLSIGPQVQHKGIDFELDVSDAPETLVTGDQGRVRQILSNLITNAMKFTDEGSISVRLRTESRSDDSLVARFEVRDTGIGISTDDQKIIFGRFAQADDSESRAYGGTGLGLAICRELVRQMGGEIGVESERGQGAMFWFTIVLGKTATQVDAPDIMGQPGSEIPDDSLTDPATVGDRPCRVLVVDDNEINRDMARHMLEKFGCDVDIAINGQEAVTRVEEQAYDLVLMDCQMPVMDGFRATRRIRGAEMEGKRDPTFIVALTANAIKGDRDRCLQAGMNDYLAKPFKLSDIRLVVDKAIGTSSQTRASTDEALDVEAILDPEALNNILSIDSGASQSLLKRYVEIFLDSAPKLLHSIGESVESKESDKLTFAAHSLKSDSYSMGATRLGELAQALEERGRNEDFSDVVELLVDARREFERVTSALMALRAG